MICGAARRPWSLSWLLRLCLSFSRQQTQRFIIIRDLKVTSVCCIMSGKVHPSFSCMIASWVAQCEHLLDSAGKALKMV